MRANHLVLRLLLVLGIFMITPGIALAQNQAQTDNSIPGIPVPYVYDGNYSTLKVDPPEVFTSQRSTLSSSAIVIEYVAAGQKNTWNDSCETFPEAAKPPFEYAAAIVSSLLKITVTVKIQACWAVLGPGILGHSGATGNYYNFTNAPQANTLYPISLANNLAGTDLNGSTAEISIAYSSSYASSFYYGTDGNPGSKLDFVTLVLHEMMHGFGFSGTMNVSGTTASWGWGIGKPAAYDRLTYDSPSGGNALINTAIYPNPSASLKSALTSGSVYFDGANAKAANGGARVPLYAPSTWSSGSSYAHLAESYNGTPNALMTYSMSSGEAIHSPGAVTLGLLFDVGWQSGIPVITAFNPTSKYAGESGFTLAITGSGFQSGAHAHWNGSDRTTTYVSPTQLNVTILAADIASIGNYPVTITNPGEATSSPVNFPVLTNPLPSVTSVFPPFTFTSQSFTITINGSGFTSRSTVKWGSNTINPTTITSTQIVATVSSGIVPSSASTSTVTVVNPSPGGGTSNSTTIQVIDPASLNKKIFISALEKH
ncbi:MAG TPA: IPT/TIG domain-containing protein [Anaerolineaceae bacterium]